jgi:acetyltransferase-like isoleucine patch superfamily enzyme
MSVRAVIKAAVRAIFLALLFPCALLSAFGRCTQLYTIFAHACALIPGIIGNYARAAYYAMTLRRFSLSAEVAFGSYFPHREVTVASGVRIGAYCIIGCVNIGERTDIASGVHVLSGQQQHTRDAEGRIGEGSILTEVAIGRDCWIGQGAIIMADVGEGATIGAGSVVGTPIPPFAVAMGNPARVVRSAVPGIEQEGAGARRKVGG